ncbi:MAG: hypothetical protein LLG13_10585 [Bacteroidales bacterium]|nr:hypothetical protein [Bacteroidales bacterium]
MSELKWKDAVLKVLEEEKGPLHYTEIAELIAEKKYRTSLGATPQDTVSATITTDINTNKEKSVFARVEKGRYILRRFIEEDINLLSNDLSSNPGMNSDFKNVKSKIINAFGIYWNRNLINWKNNPDLFGVQQLGASKVNFKEEIGIYLLHDNRETIYVGQATEQSLGQRLRNHTIDRLGGRWDRFSWFGFYPVKEDGTLNKEVENEKISIQTLNDLLEAILIESLEPRQNRKQGNLFSGLEYLQAEDPEIKKRQNAQLLRELSEKL